MQNRGRFRTEILLVWGSQHCCLPLLSLLVAPSSNRCRRPQPHLPFAGGAVLASVIDTLPLRRTVAVARVALATTAGFFVGFLLSH